MSINPANYGFYIEKQTAKGTAATMAATSYFLERIEGDVAVDKEWAKLQTGGTAGWGGGRAYLSGVKMTSDTITVMCSPKMAGAVMAWCLGDDAITGTVDPWTHTMVPAATSPWVTLWRQVDDQWQRMKDCKIVEWAFEAANEGDSIVARFVLKFAVCALPVHLATAPANLPTKETQFYTFWMGTGAWLVNMGGGSEVAQSGIGKVRIAATRPTSTPKGETFLPADAFHGVGNIELGYDVLATDHVVEFLHLFGASDPADLAAINMALVTGSLNFTLTCEAVNDILTFDVGYIEYRPEGIAIVPDANGTESYYRMVGDAEGTAPLMTVTLKNNVSTAYDA